MPTFGKFNYPQNGDLLSILPSIDREIVRPIVEAIDSLDGNVDEFLFEAGLSNDWLNPQATSLPEARVWELFELASQTMDMPTIGLQTGAELRIGDLGTFGKELEQCLTLRHILVHYIGMVNRFSSHARFWLEETENGIWFCRHGIDLIDVGKEYVEQFTVQLMIRLVQLAAGDAWIPARIRVQSTAARLYREYTLFDSIAIEYSQQASSVLIPRVMMLQIVQHEDADPVIQQIRKDASVDIGRQSLSLDEMSNRMGYSKRSLQRRLSINGLDWRRLMDQVRLEKAVGLLQSNETSLIQLAYELGFTDQANFGRAFRKWTGTSPGSYRKQYLDNKLQATAIRNGS